VDPLVHKNREVLFAHALDLAARALLSEQQMIGREFRFRRTTILMVGLAAFLGGLGFARLNAAFASGWLVMGGILTMVTLPRRRLAAVLSILILGFGLGWWRGASYLQRLEPYEELSGQAVVVEATAESDGVYTDKSQLGFDAGSIHILKPENITVPGRLKIQGFGEPAVYRGDVVQIEGKLFPTRGSRQATISYAEMKVLGRSASVIETWRREFVAGMTTALPEPHGSLGLGLLIGQRTTLPDSVNSQLSRVGLTHIIAVSGYNLTIIVLAIKRLTKKRSKYQMMVLSVSLISLFLLVTGFSASIVRAAIVSMLSLLAWYYGRTFRPVLLLLLAAVLTAGFYPLYLWSDIGWYLSFLAFYGVLVLAPLLVRRFGNKREPKLLSSVLLESFCAQLMTIPFVIYIFNQASAVALISNMIVVPWVPLAMLLSLIAGLAGMLVPVLAGLIAWPAYILLTYMLDVVNLLSRIPHALVQLNLTATGMMACYTIFLLVTFVLWRKTLSVRGTITEMENGATE
jgi:competence protein ComEC